MAGHLTFRRAAATGLTLAAGGYLTFVASKDGMLGYAPATATLTGLALAAVGIGRRTLLPQVLARGALWMTAGSSLALVALDHAGMGAVTVAALASAALVTARPLLDGHETRSFAPLRFRRTFLAGATSMAAIAFAAAVLAAQGFVADAPLMYGFNGVLALLLVAAVGGVLRMRAWGVLVGALASLLCLAAAPFYGSFNALTLSLSALPTILFWIVPIVVARMSPGPDDAGAAARRVEEGLEETAQADGIVEGGHARIELLPAEEGLDAEPEVGDLVGIPRKLAARQ